MEDFIKFITEMYRDAGLLGVVLTLLGMGGMGFIFWAAAKVNAESLEKNKKEENSGSNDA